LRNSLYSVQPIIDETIKIGALNIVHREGGVDQITRLAFEGQLADGVVVIVAARNGLFKD
jgi:hypothetical protein